MRVDILLFGGAKTSLTRWGTLSSAAKRREFIRYVKLAWKDGNASNLRFSHIFLCETKEEFMCVFECSPIKGFLKGFGEQVTRPFQSFCCSRLFRVAMREGQRL